MLWHHQHVPAWVCVVVLLAAAWRAGAGSWRTCLSPGSDSRCCRSSYVDSSLAPTYSRNTRSICRAIFTSSKLSGHQDWVACMSQLHLNAVLFPAPHLRFHKRTFDFSNANNIKMIHAYIICIIFIFHILLSSSLSLYFKWCCIVILYTHKIYFPRNYPRIYTNNIPKNRLAFLLWIPKLF